MANDRSRKEQDRENLRNIVAQWNANRLDLFELSEPNEDLEFHGVMRFYFQDDGQKVATKCIRVASTGTTKDVILTLIEKFRPDMRMLSVPQYALYEIHENGDERKLAAEEKPLLVQLNWHKDDREGRFLLRRMDQKTRLPSMDRESSNFKRKLSKREKKEKKKKEKKERLKSENDDKIAEKLYTELPETSFTRSISNPEAVMRRRRQQKLERKLQQFRNQDDAVGGTLKIFGESLCSDVPYKTLLLSLKDSAAYVVREILEKYGFEKEDPLIYCLVQNIVPHPIQGHGGGSMKEYHSNAGLKEYILDDDDCPLAIDTNFPKSKGVLTFHVRRRPADYQPRKRKKKPKQTKSDHDQPPYHYDEFADRLPFLLELNPDGSDITNGLPKKHYLHLNVTEVGCERLHASGTGQYLQLFGPNVQPRHCVLAHTEGIVTVTPSSRDAETYVNGMRIYETTILQHNIVVRFGKIHNFRFIDPLFEEKQRFSPDPRQLNESFYDRSSMKEDQASLHGSMQQVGGMGGQPNNFETTFDIDGNVETISTHSSQMIPAKTSEADQMSRKSDDLSRASVRMENRSRGCDPILPAVLEFKEEGEDMFLNCVINQADSVDSQFKLAPTYTLYMAARYRASTHYRPDMTPNERAHRLTSLMNKVASFIQLVVQDSQKNSNCLAFWMANSSELLHFLKQDRHLSAYTLDAQDVLAESVQVAFKSLVIFLQCELQQAMPAFLQDRDDVNEDEGTTGEVLKVLCAAMSLLRRCRVNAALTIQLFSQLFYYISTWLFNRIVCDPRSNYCSRLWGVRLKRRLARVEIWAEKQGLELAADCHLSRMVQAAHLLQAPKSSPEDISDISSTCFKLNSLQLRALLEKYQTVPDEQPIPHDLLANVIKVAENTADELTRSDGRQVRLEVDHELQLPFLLPEDGYSCDIVRGVPVGLQEFLYPHVSAGICRMAVQPTSSGYWTIYMSDQDIGRAPSAPGARSPSRASHRTADGGDSLSTSSNLGYKLPANLPKEPQIVTIKLKKGNSGMGLSIVAAKGAGQDKLGIYIKSVVKGGAADMDGRLQAGDQLLTVDGHSLIGISQEKAAEYMMVTGSLVNLQVARQGAIYHGLATLLNQPSPVMHRGSGHPGPRRMSERNLNQVPGDDRMSNNRIQSSKSVPSLYNGEGDGIEKPPQQQQPPEAAYNRGAMPPLAPPSSEVRPRSVNSMRYEGNAPTSVGPPPYSEQDMSMDKTSHKHEVAAPHQQPPNAHMKAAMQQQQQQQQPPEEVHYQNLSEYQHHQQVMPAAHRPNMPNGPDAYHQRPNHYNRPPAPNTARPYSQIEHNNHFNHSPSRSARYASTPEINHSHHNATGDPYDPRHRDHIRQEAKMQEMHEQVQRKDERMRHAFSAESAVGMPQRPQPPAMQQQMYAPPPGPKPFRPTYQMPPGPVPQHQLPQQQQRFRNDQNYRDSPPPPPPPTNTHPLMQSPRQPMQPPLRLPPHPDKAGTVPGLSPWEREEKERIQQMRLEEARSNRDREIDLLENLEQLTDKQEARLRTLRLEKEFQRRAEEINHDDEEDDDEDDKTSNHQTRKTENAPHSVITSHHPNGDGMRPPPPQQQQQQQQQPGYPRSMTPQQQWLARKQHEKYSRDQVNDHNNHFGGRGAPTDPHQRIDEVSRKREQEQAALRELQATKEAEHKLLQEAHRRHVEEQRHQIMTSPVAPPPTSAYNQMYYKPPQQEQPISYPAQQQYPQPVPANVQYRSVYHQPRSTATSQAEELHSQIMPARGLNTSTASPSGTQRLDSLLMVNSKGGLQPPQPPERKSSYEITAELSPNNQSLNNSKKVSFSEPTQETTNIKYDTNGNQEIIKESVQHHMSDNLMTPPISPSSNFIVGSTPGVIGAQEVYRDPRKQIQEQRVQHSRTNRGPGPEELSFKDKMKKFALEAGQPETPRDKMKISRAQRDIESKVNGGV